MTAFLSITLSSLLTVTNPVFVTNLSTGIGNNKDEVNSLTNFTIAATNTVFYAPDGSSAPGGTNLYGMYSVRDSLGRAIQFNYPAKASAGTFSTYSATSLANQSVTNFSARTNGSSSMFSTSDYSSTNQTFVWNTNFWLYSFKQRTAMVIGNGSRPPYSASISGAAVSPRHVLWPTHAGTGPGNKMLFIDDSNQSVIRTVIAISNIVFQGVYPDVQVILLDSDLPSSICPFPVLPPTFSNSLPTLYSFKKVPVAVHNQFQVVGEKTWIVSNGTNSFNVSSPAFWHPEKNITIIVNDSGGSVMLPVGTNLVLLGHLYGIWIGDSAETWPGYAELAPNINSAMHYLSTNNGLATDYQLVTNSLAPWSFY